MQMKVMLTSAGIGYHKFGLNLGTLAFIDFRHTSNSANLMMRYIMDKYWTAGTKASTAVLASISTKWFDVDPGKHEMLKDLFKMVGKIGELKVVGSAIGNSSLDIIFNIINDNHDLVPVVSKYAIETDGNKQFQLTSTEIRSKIVMGDYT